MPAWESKRLVTDAVTNCTLVMRVFILAHPLVDGSFGFIVCETTGDLPNAMTVLDGYEAVQHRVLHRQRRQLRWHTARPVASGIKRGPSPRVRVGGGDVCVSVRALDVPTAATSVKAIEVVALCRPTLNFSNQLCTKNT